MNSNIYGDARATVQLSPCAEIQSRIKKSSVKTTRRTLGIFSNAAFILVILIAAVTCLAPSSNGDEIYSETEEVLSIDEALEIALAENKRVENAVLDVEKAENTIKAARTKLFPEFNFSLYEFHHLTDEAFTFEKGAYRGREKF